MMNRVRIERIAARAAGAVWLSAHLLVQSMPLSLSLAGCDAHDGGVHDHEHGTAHDERSGGKAAEPHDGHAEEIQLSAQALVANGVAVGRVARVALASSIVAPARVAFDQERMAHVGCPVEGRIAERFVRLGDEVERGAVLFTVESPALGEAQGEYLQKKSAAERATPLVELAESGYRRVKGLYDDTKGIALAEVQRKEGEYRAALAEAEAAKFAAGAAANKLRLLGMDEEGIALLAETGKISPTVMIRAPIAGQVIDLHATLGELVSPEQEAILVLADMTRLWVIADVPEHRIHDLAAGCEARVLLGGEPDHRCIGRVSYVAPTVEPSTRAVQVRIETTDLHPELKPGVFAQVEILSKAPGDTAGVLAIEFEALHVVEGESVVFVPVAGEERTFVKRVVRVGRRVGELVPVLGGLVEGESYVSRGGFILKAELGKGVAKHEH